jgi:hypothetical protein
MNELIEGRRILSDKVLRLYLKGISVPEDKGRGGEGRKEL